jgi:biopolymer transport protein ExbB
MLAAGLVNRFHSREIMKEAIQDTGRQVVVGPGALSEHPGHHRRGAPLLGLLGTVIGMIDVFGVIMRRRRQPGRARRRHLQGADHHRGGLSVAIPALMFHRYFNGRVDKLIIGMEEQALRLIEVMKGEREATEAGA